MDTTKSTPGVNSLHSPAIQHTRNETCGGPNGASGPNHPCELANGAGSFPGFRAEESRMERYDLYQTVTNTIVAELEKGVAPWVRPWKTLDGRFGGLPYNGASHRAYRGVNVWLLAITALARDYDDPRWFTYRQAWSCGAQVRAGEKATLVIFWTQHRFEKEDPKTRERTERQVPCLKRYFVFNAAQCDGIEPMAPVVESAEVRHKRAQALVDRHQVDIRFGGDTACYVPSLDALRMPLLHAFDNEESYWSTLLHEMTHWTGSKKRLDRDLSGRFGDDAYAAEELVAEVGSAFLCAALGIDGKLRHPEYLGHWLKVLRGDKRAIFKASSLAQSAADFLLEPETVDRSEADETSGEQDTP